MRYGYIFTRLAEMIPVLLIVVVATFFLAHDVPVVPFEKDRRMPPEVKKRLEEYYGLDKPLASQLVTYVGNLCKGDLGPSLKYPGWSVNEIIGSRIPVSVQLGLTALLLAILIGIPVGVLAASRPNTWLDRVPMGFTLLGICGLSHRQSYADIFVVAVAIPVLALVVVVTLGSAFGSF
jgi:oligopeptide transport system permease protein